MKPHTHASLDTSLSLVTQSEHACQMESGQEILLAVSVSLALCGLCFCHPDKDLFPALNLGEDIMCNQLDDPESGKVIIDSFQVGSAARYECDDGFTLSGNSIRTCRANGYWSGTDPICIGKSAGCMIFSYTAAVDMVIMELQWLDICIMATYLLAVFYSTVPLHIVTCI